jgi:hypothetical protein
MADKQKNGKDLVGRQIAFDPSAESASPTEPGFIAPPKGAPVYHGSKFSATWLFRDSHLEKSPILRASSAMKAILS